MTYGFGNSRLDLAQGSKIEMHVVAGLFWHRGEVLMQRRAKGDAMAGLWEYPGGKVEPEESLHTALRRELGEELNLDNVGFDRPKPIMTVDMALGKLARIHLFPCFYGYGDFKLNVADQLVMIRPEDALNSLPMVPSGYMFHGAVVDFLKKTGSLMSSSMGTSGYLAAQRVAFDYWRNR